MGGGFSEYGSAVTSSWRESYPYYYYEQYFKINCIIYLFEFLCILEINVPLLNVLCPGLVTILSDVGTCEISPEVCWKFIGDSFQLE